MTKQKTTDVAPGLDEIDGALPSIMSTLRERLHDDVFKMMKTLNVSFSEIDVTVPETRAVGGKNYKFALSIKEES